ncbi:partner and localizer of BRCA2 [Brachionichthys hirsutus]|uniref:partner and localizer of BRCA2 n=1 Tax=Brachionichthys hirsutus TaxID=412623 RepID=UPI003604F77E
MESDAGDALHCEERLRTTLHCDDKEKLRRKLTLLQKEYLRTVQRLQRAERSEAVQKNHQDQRDPAGASNPSPKDASPAPPTTDGTASGIPTGESIPTSENINANSRTPQVIRSSLPSDGPQTERPCCDAAKDLRPGPALRLRSRRSRLRLERRCSEAGVDVGEEGREPSGGRMETDLKTEVVGRSEDQSSDTESESPSLLLSHWNASKTGETEGNGKQGGQEQREKDAEVRSGAESASPLLTRETEEKEHKDIQTGSEVRGAGLPESRTLVEGLLFPAEYYVRTTRRMTSSRSQPGTQTAILSQLDVGRHRRSRGRGPTGRTLSPSDGRSACRMDADACASPTIATAPPSRGRKRRRSRRRPQTSRLALSLDGEARPASARSTPTPPSSGGTPAASRSAAGRPVYSVFLNGNGRTSRSSQTSADTCQSLLLPSSPSAHAALLPPSALSLGQLVKNLMTFDLLQDFHLPDDQFASLKLHKLRQVAVETGVELFASPSYNTRRSARRYEALRGDGEAVAPLPLPLSLTPATSRSSDPAEGRRDASDAQNAIAERHPAGESASESTGERQTDPVPPRRRASASVSQVHDGAKETSPVSPSCPRQIHVSCMTKRGSVEQPRSVSADGPEDKEDVTVSRSEGQTPPVRPPEDVTVSRSEGQTPPARPPEDVTVSRSEGQTPPVRPPEDVTVSRSEGQTPPVRPPEDETSASHQSEDEAAAGRGRDERVGPGESPVQSHEASPPSKELTGDATSPPPLHRPGSQLLLSPPSSSALDSHPNLPTLGVTPLPEPAALPPTASPSAPALILPPPFSPSSQARSPPALSPCPSLTPLPPSPPAAHTQALSGRVDPPALPTTPGVESQDGHARRAATLTAPAGGRLVDVCCLPASSGGFYVAAAGKWAVCLWSPTAASDWSLTHTWTFNKPVINVFPVPDASGLMCVTLGQLEITEVRLLSCAGLLQLLFYEGLVQAVVGMPKSRVVASFHAASGSALQVSTLSDGGSTLNSRPLVSPGVCVGALAPVDGLPDALIGTDDGGRLFVWNLRTGHLLRRLTFGDGVSHAACLSGYSYCGVLFVLLQHQFLCSLGDEETQDTEKESVFLEEGREGRKQTAPLSLVAINPLNGKSTPASRLYPPTSWSGRLCEADVSSRSVVGLSQSGCVCVWELGGRGASWTVGAPESEGWQLARWGGGGTLLMGHHNGDVTLHRLHR